MKTVRKLAGGAVATLCLFSLAAAESPLEKLVLQDRKLKEGVQRAVSRQNIDLIRNGTFSRNGENWRLHRCSIRNGVCVFANADNDYSQLQQVLAYALPAGMKVRLEVDAVVSDPEGALARKGILAQYKVLFQDKFRKKTLYADGERGKAGTFTAADGKKQTFQLEFTVPEGAAYLLPTIALNVPIRLEISAIRLLAAIDGKLAEKLDVELPAVYDASAVFPPPEKLQVPGQICRISYPCSIVIDGSQKDWEKIPFAGKGNYPIPSFVAPNGEDGSFRFKLAMDDENLYVLVLITDDKLQFKEFGDFNSDSVELFFSPVFSREARNGPADFHITIAPEDRTLNQFNLTGSDYRRYFLPRVKGIASTSGWGVEVAIPLRNRLFEIYPYDGYVCGFNIQYNDNDSGLRDHKVSWAPDSMEQSWNRPDVLGAAVLRTGHRLPVRPAAAVKHDSRKEEKIRFINRVPGTLNVLRNGGFEQGDSGWTNWYGVNGGTTQIRGEAAFSGKAGAVIDARVLQYGERGTSLNSHAFPVIPGQKYRLSFQAKCDSALPVDMEVSFKSQDYRITYIPVHCSFKPGEGWKKFSGEFTIPANYDRENGLIQLMIRGRNGGSQVCFDDFELVHFNPGKLDALLDFDCDGFAFPVNEGRTARLTVHNADSRTEEAVLQVSFRDFFHANREISRRSPEVVKLEPGEKREIVFPVLMNRRGLFQILVQLIDSRTGETVTRRTEYAVYEPPAAVADYAGACMGHHHLPSSAAALVSAMKAAGIGSTRVFIDRGQEYSPGKFDFSTLDTLVDELKKRGMTIIASLSTSGFAMNGPSSYEPYLRALASHFKGRIQYYELGNEPNIWQGWPPKPSAPEYAVFQRLAYSVIRSTDPGAVIMNAGINRGALDDFTRELLSLNSGNFYDVYAFHPYDFAGSAGYRAQMEETLRVVNSYRAGTEVWDSESGSATSDSYQTVLKLARKIPAFLYLGVKRHYEWGFDRMSSGHMYAYGGSPGASYPVYAWLTGFYPSGCRSLGGSPSKSLFEYYAVETPAGEKRLAVWRSEPSGREEFRVPALPQSRVYDCFGNDVTAAQKRSGNELFLKPAPELPLYVSHCGDLSSLNLVAFHPGRGGENLLKKSEDVLLLPREVAGFFDRSIPGNATEKIRFSVKNFSRRRREVHLEGQGRPDGMKTVFPSQKIVLEPGGEREVSLAVSVPEKGKFLLNISGTADGMPLASLPVRIQASGLLAAALQGRYLKLKNNAPHKVTCRYSIVCRHAEIRPMQMTGIELAPGEEKKIELTILPHTLQRFQEDGRLPLEVTVSCAENTYTETLFCAFVHGEQGKPEGGMDALWFDRWGELVPLRLKSAHDAEPFEARLRVRYEGSMLYLSGIVKDISPNMEGKLGYLSQGDSVLIGVNSGKDAFEAGFSAASHPYRWDGTFGLEAAKAFPEAQCRFFWRDDGYAFNVAIPLAATLESGKQIGLALRFVNKTADGKLEHLTFGDGLGLVKDFSQLGILLL